VQGNVFFKPPPRFAYQIAEIATAARDEFIITTAFNYRITFDYKKLLRGGNSQQMAGDGKRQRADSTLNHHFRFRIECRCGPIQERNLSIC